MTEQSLPIAVEARELGKSAHKRLDGINGQISRLNDKADVIDQKLTSVLITLARDDGHELGERTVRTSVLDSRWRVAGLVATFLCSSGFAVVITVLLRGH